MNHVLYVSTLSSEKVLQYLYDSGKEKPIPSAQKFHRLIVNGLANYRDRVQVQTLSCPPVIPSSHNRMFWWLPKERNSSIIYDYVPFINYAGLKSLTVFLSTFFKTFFWCITKKRNSRIVICDVLMVTLSTAALLACKLTRTRSLAIVTDLPGLMITGSTEKKIRGVSGLHYSINFAVLTRFSQYLLLTAPMNEIVNPNNRPSIIMEGLVDADMAKRTNNLNEKATEKIVIYAGGLYEEYGIKSLIEGFIKLDDKNARLHLYGSGKMTEDIKEYAKKDQRIIYKGMVPNNIVVDDQLKATLLVNPRPTTEKFTQYSFPSKNMEYMASGTPTLTTLLPGMPEEYKEFVFLIKDEGTDGMHRALYHTLCNTAESLHEFGKKAKLFVLKNKNNKVQANRLLNFIGW